MARRQQYRKLGNALNAFGVCVMNKLAVMDHTQSDAAARHQVCRHFAQKEAFVSFSCH
jgi:hypothetical protein